MKATTATALAGMLITSAHLSATAFADDVDCPPNLGNITIDGNVLVAAPCELDGTTVKGNVHLYAGGSLVARNADIDGNIQAENADYVDVAGTYVGGSIQLDDLVGDLTVINDNIVNGNIQLDSNRSRLEVSDNSVGADIQAFSNSGGIDISDNVVDGSLQCKSNDPDPTGGNNQVSGNKEDQCANLSAASGGSSNATGSSSGNSAAAGNVDDSAGSGGGAFGPFALLLGFIARYRIRAIAGHDRLRLV